MGFLERLFIGRNARTLGVVEGPGYRVRVGVAERRGERVVFVRASRAATVHYEILTPEDAERLRALLGEAAELARRADGTAAPHRP